MSKLLTPVCFLIGHEIVPAEDKPGWFKIGCGRCGQDTHHRWLNRTRSIPYKIERSLVWVANQMARTRNYPGAYWPVYRHIEQQIKGIGTEHSVAAYSYEHIQSLLKQYKDDGLPEPKLSELISEEGWVNLEDNPEAAQQVIDDITRGVNLLRTKQEQEELNK